MTRKAPTPVRLFVGAVVALALGLGLATLGSFLVSDFVTVSDADGAPAYLVSLPDDEDMLRQLSADLARGISDDPAVLGDIAPAAGAPLGE